MFKILVVESDKKTADMILENIVKQKFNGMAVSGSTDVFTEFVDYNPHLLVLDIDFPNDEGFKWASQIKRVSKVPIIFISSNNKLDTIEAGNFQGYDYVTKPLSIEMLMNKIDIMLDKTYSHSDPNVAISEYKGVVINENDSSVVYKGLKEGLSTDEFQVLSILMANHGNIISKERIVNSLHHYGGVGNISLDVTLNGLTKKMNHLGLDNYIQERMHQGYII